MDAGWVQAQLLSGAVVVVDTRDPEAYAAEHIAGAVNVPVSATYDTTPERKTELAPVATVAALFGAAGISLDTPVVLYDDSNFRSAARMFWVLETHGHPHTAVLNRGLTGWKEHGFEVSAESTVRSPRRFIANLQPERLVSKLQVRQSIGDEQLILLDSRSAAEYVGQESRTERAGHIPSALNIDFMQAMNEDEGVCELYDREELRAAYAQVLPSERVITYCNTGTRASVSYLVLRSLGRDVAVYDGSWVEWSADPSLPIETGAPASAQLGSAENGAP